MHRIIDAHLDLAWNALSFNRDQTDTIEELRRQEAGMTDMGARCRATVSLPELRKANVPVCVATILARAKRDVRAWKRTDLDHATQDIAHAVGQAQLAYYRRLEQRGEMRFIVDREGLKEHWDAWEQSDRSPVGFILSMEGADPIIDPSEVQAWFAQGLRAIGLAHYGQGHYAFGTGGAGPLTPRGRELVKEMDRLGMILDLTHSSDPSFFEALDLFGGRVLASHNNCRALVPGDRQYSDEQIKRLIDRDAVIGAVLDAWMLFPNWKVGQSDRSCLTLEAVADHIDHVCQIAGNAKHSAIGSDLDGGFGTEQCPTGLDTIVDLHRIGAILSKRGYRDDQVADIFHGNWRRLFSEALPARELGHPAEIGARQVKRSPWSSQS